MGGGGDVADGGRWAAVGVERRAESPQPRLAALQPLLEIEESAWLFCSQRCVVWETAREDRRNAEAAKAVPWALMLGVEPGRTERVGDLSGAGQLVSKCDHLSHFLLWGRRQVGVGQSIIPVDLG